MFLACSIPVYSESNERVPVNEVQITVFYLNGISYKYSFKYSLLLQIRTDNKDKSRVAYMQ